MDKAKMIWVLQQILITYTDAITDAPNFTNKEFLPYLGSLKISGGMCELLYDYVQADSAKELKTELFKDNHAPYFTMYWYNAPFMVKFKWERISALESRKNNLERTINRLQTELSYDQPANT
nr:hypothetical protein [uncultured Flavobacterium sp.]